ATSPIRTVADLKGKRFAYIDRDSGSGFLAPNRVFQAASLDPLHDLAQVEFTYSHSVSVKHVQSGVVDAAAIHEGALEAARNVPPALRVIATSEPLDPDVIVAAANLPPDLRESALKLLLEMNRTPEGQQ